MKRQLLIVTMTTMFATASWALGSYTNSFSAKYDAAGSKLNGCAVCHTTVPGLNSYGLDLQGELDTNGSDLDLAMAAIESKDSDGDGYSNIVEIQARTWPGDANDSPPTAVEPASWSQIKNKYRKLR